MKNKNYELKDDFKLLDLMIKSANHQPELYLPGKYWEKKSKETIAGIIEFGVSEFRGKKNNIGTSFTDNLFVDIRETKDLNKFKSFARNIMKKFPFNRLFNSQVLWTHSYAALSLMYAEEILNLKERAGYLYNKYNFPYSTLGDCASKVVYRDKEVSIFYFSIIDQHDYISYEIDFKRLRSVFEIGGGFGANIHFLLNNYTNIKKILYLDIVPNLYIATQYLKAFFGNAVYDYSKLADIKNIKFSENDNLEIYCIAPWQIENFDDSIDLFTNSHSFVEIPSYIIENYVNKIKKFKNYEKTQISLVSYDNFDLTTTFHPNLLPKYFKTKKFTSFSRESLLTSARKNLYYITT